ncbi:unnamed protein product [Schistosoma mattheei]|uniref:Uncharacterized protein n=1 Tax=Schistosoma mattheei TaxID=31246 RepID=A0A183PIN8_9TREM|nr:unnamed protein product [Schistosoma mattheei]
MEEASAKRASVSSSSGSSLPPGRNLGILMITEEIGKSCSHYNSNTPDHHIGVAMEPAMEKLDIHSISEAFEDYFERFEIWAVTKEDDEDVNIVVHFLTFIGKEAYSLLRTLAMPEKPISLSYTTFKDLLLHYVKYTNFECGKGGRSSKMIHEDLKNSTTLPRHSDPVHTQGYADSSLRSCNAFHENGHKFSQCLSCGKFHFFNSCTSRNSKCFKCGDIGYIQSVCNTNVHLIAYLLTYACYSSRRSIGRSPAFSIQPCSGQSFLASSSCNSSFSYLLL